MTMTEWAQMMTVLEAMKPGLTWTPESTEPEND